MDHAIKNAAVRRPVVLALSVGGFGLAKKLAKAIDADIHGLSSRCPDAHYQFDNTIDHIAALFIAGRPVIGVCAAAILIRAVAPHLGHKSIDAPVLAVAEDGSNIVPLLGLHHGALVLGSKIRRACGGHLGITTASNLGDAVSLDTPPPGLRLANPENITKVMATLLAGGGAKIDGCTNKHCIDSNLLRLTEWLKPLPCGDDVVLTIGDAPVEPAENQLVYCPQSFIIGIGCARGADVEEVFEFVSAQLIIHDIHACAIAAIASIDLKADEPAILVLAERLDVPFRVFTANELEALTPRLANPSQTVFDEIGAHGVAEAAALASACSAAVLHVEKQKSRDATMAAVRLKSPCNNIASLPGRKPGKVMLIGIGPGKGDWRTPEASRWVHSADELVGYGLYIDLLGSVAAHLPRKDFALGEEEARCRYALETAAKGRDVAIICSGDAGIYAMGALVFELLDREPQNGGVTAAAHRVQILSAPGISALQAAAAQSGAILGHDFCTISLSDLLTPWESIEARIHAAGVGDFVIAFYNPVSRRRRTQLAAARDILKTYRGGEVPVLLASNLGRPEEESKFRTLGTLDIDEVDMLTIVIVGSSTSRLLDLGRGKVIYTPRGYAKKNNKI